MTLWIILIVTNGLWLAFYLDMRSNYEWAMDGWRRAADAFEEAIREASAT